MHDTHISHMSNTIHVYDIHHIYTTYTTYAIHKHQKYHMYILNTALSNPIAQSIEIGGLLAETWDLLTLPHYGHTGFHLPHFKDLQIRGWVMWLFSRLEAGSQLPHLPQFPRCCPSSTPDFQVAASSDRCGCLHRMLSPFKTRGFFFHQKSQEPM